jgi:hypothetical protein
MEWDVRFTDGFGEWWDGLTEDEQESVNASVPRADKLYAEYYANAPAYRRNEMTRNFKDLQQKMAPASRARREQGPPRC